MRRARLRTMICTKHRSIDLPQGFPVKGATMNDRMHNWLHDLAVALGLIPPPLQPVPIPTDKDRDRRPRRR